MKRPNLTVEDARVLKDEIPSLQAVGAVVVRASSGCSTAAEKTQSIEILGSART